MLTRIYSRSLEGLLWKHYRLLGNQKRLVFANVLEGQLELCLTTVQVTANSVEILIDRLGVSSN